MKFNRGLLSSILSSLLVLPLVTCTTSSQDLDTCRKACSYVRPRLIRLIEPNTPDSEWNDLKPYWSTCQYRCYRCTLPGANRGMEDMESLFSTDKRKNPDAIKRMAENIDQIDLSMNVCFDKWTYMIRLGDNTSTLT